MKPMFEMTGQLINVYETPAGTTKGGKEYDSSTRIEILGQLPIDNGQYRSELRAVKVDDITPFKPFLGKQITIPVSFFAAGKDVIVTVLKGFKPRAVGAE